MGSALVAMGTVVSRSPELAAAVMLVVAFVVVLAGALGSYWDVAAARPRSSRSCSPPPSRPRTRSSAREWLEHLGRVLERTRVPSAGEQVSS
jgi:hypothetical protein